jgi:metallothionein
MVNANSVKCACPKCSCVISITDAVMKDGKPYCGQACATGHVGGQGCGNSGCGCNA